MLFVTLLASCVIAGCAARRTWVLAPGQLRAGADAGGRVQNFALSVMRSVRGTPTILPIGL